jgi:glutathione peroxidase
LSRLRGPGIALPYRKSSFPNTERPSKKNVFIVLGLAILLAAGISIFFLRGAMATGSQAPEKPSEGVFWDLETRTLAGEAVALDAYEGKVALVVNVASKCGLTPQYKGLQALYEKHAEEGFVILAFPSNDFMGQEPGTPEEIQEFCSTNYAVTFPLFEKVKVKGDDKCEIYGWLTSTGLEEPTWNFTKYLIGKDGQLIARYAPKTEPDDEEMTAAIAAALK